MTWWSWVAVGLMASGYLIATVLERRESPWALDAKIVSTVVTRLVVAALLIWAITRLERTPDSLHLGLGVVLGVVVLLSVLWATVGIKLLFDRSDD
jgi:hypothetical protein